jgi:IclR family KDG regulon transcriptional repressor
VSPREKKLADVATHSVRALDRAIDILECFTHRQKELSRPEIVDITGLDRSTTRRLLANLARRGFIEEAASTGRYRLGLRLFEMGGIVFSSFSLPGSATESLSILQGRVSGTIMLAARSGDHFVIVDKREGVFGGLAMVSMRSETGTVRPLTYGPIGRVFMSTFSKSAARALLEKYPLEEHTPYSIKDVDQFLEGLSAVRDFGYAMDVNEVVEGIMGLAAPIAGVSGEIVGVLCVGVPATRENDVPFVQAALASLLDAAKAISTRMGYRGDGAQQVEEPVEEEAFIPAD